MVTQTDKLRTSTFAQGLRGYCRYAHSINIIYSMVSIPWRNVLSTPAGGTQPLITLLVISNIYRYNKHHNRHTKYPIMISSPPTYQYSPPAPHHALQKQHSTPYHITYQYHFTDTMPTHQQRRSKNLKNRENQIICKKCDTNGLKEPV